MYISRTTALSPAALTIGQNVSLFTSVTCPTTASAVSMLDDRTTTLALLFSCVGTDTPTDDEEEQEIAIECGAAHDGEAEERIGGGERERRRAIVPNRRDSFEGIGEDRSVEWWRVQREPTLKVEERKWASYNLGYERTGLPFR